MGWIDGGIWWKFGLLILDENVGIGSIHMEGQDRFIGLERGVCECASVGARGRCGPTRQKKWGLGHVNQYCKHKPLYHGYSGMN